MTTTGKSPMWLAYGRLSDIQQRWRRMRARLVIPNDTSLYWAHAQAGIEGQLAIDAISFDQVLFDHWVHGKRTR